MIRGNFWLSGNYGPLFSKFCRASDRTRQPSILFEKLRSYFWCSALSPVISGCSEAPCGFKVIALQAIIRS